MRCSRGIITRKGAIGGSKLRALAGTTLLAATAACGDRANGPDAVSLEGRRIDGSLTLVSRIVDPGSGLPRTVWMDSSAFSAEMRDGIAITKDVRLGGGTTKGVGGGRPLTSEARSGAEGLELVVAQRRGSARQGTWRRQVKGKSGAVREVELAAHGGEPISERTIYENGAPVVKVIESWRREGAGWLLTERSVIAYRNGVAAGSLSIVVTASVAQVAGASGMLQKVSVATVDALAPAVALVTRAMTPAVLHAEMACEKELQAVDDAMDNYLFATILFGASLLSANPVFVAGAAVNEVKAARQLQVAEDRFDECIGGVS